MMTRRRLTACLRPTLLASLLLMVPFAASGQETAAPPVLLPASENSVLDTVTIPGATDAPVTADLSTGLLASAEHPGLQIIPRVEVTAATHAGTVWVTTLRLTGLIPFGESTVPVFYHGTKIQTLRLLKSGLALETPLTAQREKEQILLVLQNPSGFNYTSVRARLRFRDQDVCTFAVERFPNQDARAAAQTPKPDCDQVESWTQFAIPQYAGISLRALPLHAWFIDGGTGFSRTLRQKGSLTLRFAGTAAAGQPAPIYEQTLPLEVEFEPGTGSRTRDFLVVGGWLLLGALFSVILRVAIPNYRRYRSLRDQLVEIRKTTRGVSEEVDSMLRVQLRVERLGLDTLRKSVSVISPGFAEVAERVEAASTTLNRRVEYVRRLDAALNRKRLLIADELAQPTRIAAIDRNLNAASEELKSDQFREQDWVFIQQALEAADKTLSDASAEEKSAFESFLVQRWKSISAHFVFKPDLGLTHIPRALAGMEICFPEATALPSVEDPDGSQWIKSIGTVRADLQISALELIREFEFLAPSQINGGDKWTTARTQLISWLATPALENLNDARLLLRQLSEGIDPHSLITALQNGGAHIELDPQSVGSGERVHLAIRFWQSNNNSAAARQQITCEWHFKASAGKFQSGSPQIEPPSTGSFLPRLRGRKLPTETLVYREKGWEIYHYFESISKQCPLEVLFYFEGRPVLQSPTSTDPLVYSYIIDLQVESAARAKAAKGELLRRTMFESLELLAALLIPLCALAVSTADEGSSGHWWQLVALGFGSDTIRSVLGARPGTPAPKPQP